MTALTTLPLSCVREIYVNEEPHQTFDSSVGRAWDCNLQPYLSAIPRSLVRPRLEGRYFVSIFSYFISNSDSMVPVAGCVRAGVDEAFDKMKPSIAQLEERGTVICNLISGPSQGRWFDPGSKDFLFTQFFRISLTIA